MLSAFRSELAAYIAALGVTDAGGQPLDVWGRVPDDVNMLPCVVVGYPTARPAIESASVFDRTATVYVVARRVDAGDNEGELVRLADELWTALGGTRGFRTGGEHFTLESLDHRVVQVAGLDHDAYLIPVTSPTATC